MNSNELYLESPIPIDHTKLILNFLESSGLVKISSFSKINVDVSYQRTKIMTEEEIENLKNKIN